jgi:hypothetical protein
MEWEGAVSWSEHRKLRHARVKEVLFEASQLELAARSEFLDRACAGDRALRDEVESLLSYHEGRVADREWYETEACGAPGTEPETLADAEPSKPDVTPLPSAPSDDAGRGGERKRSC